MSEGPKYPNDPHGKEIARRDGGVAPNQRHRKYDGPMFRRSPNPAPQVGRIDSSVFDLLIDLDQALVQHWFPSVKANTVGATMVPIYLPDREWLFRLMEEHHLGNIPEVIRWLLAKVDIEDFGPEGPPPMRPASK